MMTPKQIEEHFKKTVIHALYLHSCISEASCRKLTDAIHAELSKQGINLTDAVNVPCGTKREEQNAEWLPSPEFIGDRDQTAIETVREMKQAHTSGSGITLSYSQLHAILLNLHP